MVVSAPEKLNRKILFDRDKWTNDATDALINFAQLCYSRSWFASASYAYRIAIGLTPARQRLWLIPLCKCEIRRRQFSKALTCFLRQCDFPTAPKPNAEVVVLPTLPRGSHSQKTICVVTSLMPRRIEAQQAAVRSWLAAGLSVVSVNSTQEVAELKGHFPEITFKVPDVLAEDSSGRLLIPINAMIRAAADSAAAICGIINSDIQFRGGPAFFDHVRQETKDALVFGNRIDYEDDRFKDGKAYRFGYDFFFWERKNSVLFEGAPMVLGLPWWDFWMPLHARGQGLTTKRFATAAMAHITHPQGYDVPAFLQFEHYFATTLAGVFGRWRDKRVPAERRFLHRLFTTAATVPVTEDNELARRRVMAVCDLSNCLVDATARTVVLPDAHLAANTLDVL